MKNIPAINVILLTLTGMTAAPVSAETRFDLIVAPQTDTTLTEAGALGVLRVLRSKMTQSCGQMRMFLTFQPLPASFLGDANGGSLAELKRFRDTGTSVQVVPVISRCPDPARPGQIFGGCTPKTGPILLRDYPAGNADQQTRLAQKWGHEMGHAQGLIGSFSGYVNSHNPSADALMYWQAGPSRWQLSAAECDVYYADQTFPPFVASPVIADAETAGDTVTDATAPPAADGPVEVMPLPEEPAPGPPEILDGTSLQDDFLRGDWMGDFPVREIDKFQGDLLPQAEQAIAQDVFELWPGSVVVLAYAAQNGAVSQLEKVLDFDAAGAGIEPGSDAAYQINEAKIRAAGALSFLTYRQATGDYDGDDADQALALLSGFSDLAVANTISFAPDGRSALSLAQQSALSANAGLALAAGIDQSAQDRLIANQSGNASGSADLGVDNSYFQALNDRAAIGRARNSAGSFPLLEALTQ